MRLRTNKTKGCSSRIACLTKVFELALSAQKCWRNLNGASLLADVIAGVAFVEGRKRDAASSRTPTRYLTIPPRKATSVGIYTLLDSPVSPSLEKIGYLPSKQYL